MRQLRFSYYLFLIFILKSNVIATKNNVGEDLRVRVRRQDGYVYDKPNISFDLPSRPTTETTQAPNVDRILEQQMYYAYPAPASGDIIKIGSTAGTTVSTTAASAAPGVSSGYNYPSTISNSVGYKYGTPLPGVTKTQANTASQVFNAAAQNSVSSAGSAINTSSKIGSGYNYKSPSATLSTSVQGSAEVSTSAPRYLPPAAGGATDSLGLEVNIDNSGGSAFSGIEQVTGSNTATQVGSTSVATLSESYLPPLVNDAGSKNKSPTLVSISTQTNQGGSISVPSTAYLPPKSSQSPSPLQTLGPTSISQPAAPVSGYIPPTNAGSKSGTQATSTGYLPPGFF